MDIPLVTGLKNGGGVGHVWAFEESLLPKITGN